jgi:hypothetical protein
MNADKPRHPQSGSHSNRHSAAKPAIAFRHFERGHTAKPLPTSPTGGFLSRVSDLLVPMDSAKPGARLQALLTLGASRAGRIGEYSNRKAVALSVPWSPRLRRHFSVQRRLIRAESGHASSDVPTPGKHKPRTAITPGPKRTFWACHAIRKRRKKPKPEGISAIPFCAEKGSLSRFAIDRTETWTNNNLCRTQGVRR